MARYEIESATVERPFRNGRLAPLAVSPEWRQVTEYRVRRDGEVVWTTDDEAAARAYVARMEADAELAAEVAADPDLASDLSDA